MCEENSNIQFIPVEEALEEIVVNWNAQNKPEALVDMHHRRYNTEMGFHQTIAQEYAWTKGVFVNIEEPDWFPGPYDGHYQIQLIFDSLKNDAYLRFKKLIENFEQIHTTEEEDYLFVLIGDGTKCYIADFVLSGGYVNTEKPNIVMWADPKMSHARYRKDTSISIWKL